MNTKICSTYGGVLTLELNRLTRDVDQMGRAMTSRREELAGRAAEAGSVLASQPQVTKELLQKIETARRIDEWRRGAVPLGNRLDERRRADFAVPRAVLIAADGSQIFPDRSAVTLYYLLNIGAIVFREGSGAAPACISQPTLYYRDEELYDADGQLRTEEYVGALRNRLELATLADLAVAEREAMGGDLSTPIVVLIDGPLLPWIRSGTDNEQDARAEIDFFITQMQRLRAVQAIPIGYIDRPRSAYVLRILELIDMPLEEITRDKLRFGPFVGLTDGQLFESLRPGERTGLFVPNSRANERYEARSATEDMPGDRITFCYANMARQGRNEEAELARLEMPGWVAGRPDLIDVAQSVIAANCEPGPFPYVLARAHELALVTEDERAALDDLVSQIMWRNGLTPQLSTKAWTKQLTRRPRRS